MFKILILLGHKEPRFFQSLKILDFEI